MQTLHRRIANHEVPLGARRTMEGHRRLLHQRLTGQAFGWERGRAVPQLEAAACRFAREVVEGEGSLLSRERQDHLVVVSPEETHGGIRRHFANEPVASAFLLLALDADPNEGKRRASTLRAGALFVQARLEVAVLEEALAGRK